MIISNIRNSIQLCRDKFSDLHDYRNALSLLFNDICKDGKVDELAKIVCEINDSFISVVAIECLSQSISGDAIIALRLIASSSNQEINSLANDAAFQVESISKSLALFREGCELLWNYRLDEAEKLFDKVRLIDHAGPVTALCRGVMAYENAKYDEALTEFIAITDGYGWIADVHIHLGQTYRQLGLQNNEEGGVEYFKSSCDSYEEARRCDPSLSFIDIGLAWTYLKVESSPVLRDQVDERKKALQEAEECIKRIFHANDLVANITYARILEKRAKLEDSELAEQLHDRAGEFIEYVINHPSTSTSTLVYAYGAKAVRILQREKKEALKLCMLARDLAGKQTPSKIYQLINTAQTQLNRMDDALVTCNEWVKLYPNDPNSHVNLGRKLSNNEDAYCSFHRAFLLSTPNSGTRSYIIPFLAKSLISKGKPFDAIKVLESASTTVRGNYQTQQIIKTAKQDATKIRSKSLNIYRNVLQIFRNIKMSEEASRELLQAKRDEIDSALIFDPEYSRLWVIRSRIEFNLNNFQTATRDAEKAVSFLQDHQGERAEAEFQLGCALKRLGRFEEAQVHFETANSNSDSLSESFKIIIHKELTSLQTKKRPVHQVKASIIEVLNPSNGRIEKYDILDIQAFVSHLAKILPIGATLAEIDNKPFFLRAATGVGKTVVTPMHLFLQLLKNVTTNEVAQVFVVEPRIPIAIDECRHMNVTFFEFMKQKSVANAIRDVLSEMPLDESFELSRSLLLSDELSEKYISNALDGRYGFSVYNSVHKQLINRLIKLIATPIDLIGKTGPFGVASSVYSDNILAPVVFVTTGIFEMRAIAGDLIPGIHRVLIDEAHITIENNPGIELAICLCRLAGVCVDFMSATVDSTSLPYDLGVKVIDCQKEQHPVEYRVCNGKLDDVLESLVRESLVLRSALSKELYDWDRKEDPNSRAVGMLVVVNSHLAENSDTLRIRNRLKSVPDFAGIDVLRLASPVVRNFSQRQAFNDHVKAIEKRCGRYVIIATNVVEMGITFPSLDFIVTMDNEYVTVPTSLGESLQLQELGLNALKQRAGRVGRKRPGVCFITKDFDNGKGAEYTKLTGDQIKALPPAKIRYPLEKPKADLRQLAKVSFIKCIREDDLFQWIKELSLPSKILDQQHILRLINFRKELELKGLADESGITELGKAVDRYIGVDDVDFARMAELCRPSNTSRSSPEDREMFRVMIAVAALSSFSLSSLFYSTVSLQKEERRRRGALTATEKIGPISEDVSAVKITQILEGRKDSLLNEMLDLDVMPSHATEIVKLLNDGFHTVTLNDICGSEPNQADGKYKSKKEYENAKEYWLHLVNMNKDFIHFEKPIVSLNNQSELLAVYEIVEYFFRNHSQLFIGEPSVYLREKLEKAFDLDADRIEVKKHVIKAAIDSVLKLFRYLREEVPKREVQYSENLRPSSEDLEHLLSHYVELTCATLNVSVRNVQKLANIAYNYAEGKQLVFATDYAKLASSSKLPIQEVTLLMKTVLNPVWNEYMNEWTALRFRSITYVLPRLRSDVERKVLKHIRNSCYGTKITLDQGEISYSTTAKVNDITRPVNLMTATTSLSLKERQVKIQGKFSTGIRSDGEEIISVTHATLMQEESE